MCAGLAAAPSDSHAFLGGLFGKKDKPTKTPDPDERQRQEAAAADLIREAGEAESRGKTSKALDNYRDVTRKYPFTSAASVAQFKVGELYEKEGKYERAFDAYQTLIEEHKQSAQFSSAVDRQYQIASEAQTGERKTSFLGIPKKLNRDLVVEMFEKIIKNAPYTKEAADSQFAIGEIYEDLDDDLKAVGAYQAVVDNYADSAKATEARYRIGSINKAKVDRGSYDPANLREAKEQMADVVLTAPDSEQAIEAREVIETFTDAEIEKHYEVAKFYEKKGNTRAAAIYYNEILKTPGSSRYDDARTALEEIVQADPDALAGAPATGPESQVVVKANTDTVSRPDYAGPAADELRALLAKPKARTGRGPVSPVSEPDLPVEGGDFVVPPPPPDPGVVGADPGLLEADPGIMIPESEGITLEPDAPVPPAPESETPEGTEDLPDNLPNPEDLPISAPPVPTAPSDVLPEEEVKPAIPAEDAKSEPAEEVDEKAADGEGEAKADVAPVPPEPEPEPAASGDDEASDQDASSEDGDSASEDGDSKDGDASDNS
ncbi:MAG: tetratricopeptide repeat protein [Verrucomicrobiales bacterium]